MLGQASPLRAAKQWMAVGGYFKSCAPGPKRQQAKWCDKDNLRPVISRCQLVEADAGTQPAVLSGVADISFRRIARLGQDADPAGEPSCDPGFS